MVALKIFSLDHILKQLLNFFLPLPIHLTLGITFFGHFVFSHKKFSRSCLFIEMSPAENIDENFLK